MEKQKLKKVLIQYLYKKKYHPIQSENYIIAEGDIPICLVAHMDTVFSSLPDINEFYYDAKEQVLWNPAGSGFDDRAGIYAILQILKSNRRPHIIFTDLEEKGGIGSSELITKMPICPFVECKCLIQLDRCGYNDMVFYDCDNLAFTTYIKKFGFEENFGSFSDISTLAPAWKIAAVNLSIGYDNEHSCAELLHCNWTDQTIKKVNKILDKADDMDSYQYIPLIWTDKSWRVPFLGLEYEFPVEEDINNTECSICNKPLVKSYYSVLGINSYNICEECFKQYYDDGITPYIYNTL